MNWRWIITVVLLAALLAGYSAFLRREPSGTSNNNTLEQPGYFLEDAVVTQSNADGSPGIALTAKRIEQRQRTDEISLIDVELDYLQTAEQRWNLKAQRAVVPPDSRIVQFRGDVELRPRNSTEPTYLRTQALTVDTEKNLAYSDDSPVEVRLGPYLLTAQGIQVDLKREKVRMRDVDGRAAPGSRGAASKSQQSKMGAKRE